MKFTILLSSLSLTFLLAIPVTAAESSDAASASTWSPQTAARYLDARESWWQTWPRSQRDHETACVSCHSVVPYALSRPILRRELGEQDISAPERTMLGFIEKRVGLWNEVEPFYKSSALDPNKAVESRGTEAVLNALILSSYDAAKGHLSDTTRAAFDAVWTMQVPSGKKGGAWVWLNFHYSPWESDESQYWGATMAALAVGTAPDHYRDDPKIQTSLNLLRDYLKRDYAAQPLFNKISLLWASTRLPGLMNDAERTALIDLVIAKKNEDGGWSLSSLADFKRRDGTPLETKSDGYATGLTLLAFEEAGLAKKNPAFAAALTWLKSSQDKNEGLWPAWSVNKQRDPASEIGRFMSDAATAYAVMAIEKAR